MLNRSKPYCHYFNTKGGCKFKENCRFLHSRPNISSVSTGNRENGSPVRDNKEQASKNFPRKTSAFIETNENGKVVKESTDQPSEKSNRFPIDSQSSENENAVKLQGQRNCLADDLNDLSITYNNDIKAIKKSQEKQSSKEEYKICFAFQKSGRCRFENNCRYIHIAESNVEGSGQISRPRKQGQHDFSKRKTHRNDDEKGRKKGKRICDFYRAGHCQRGDRCQFYHPQSLKNVDVVEAIVHEDEEIEQQNKNRSLETEDGEARRETIPQTSARSFYHARPNMHEFKREGISEDDVVRLRETEINQLKKRLASNDLQIVVDGDDKFCFKFGFSSSDPDWPYDVDTYQLQITLPKNYPIQMFTISLPVEQELPETVRRCIEVSLVEWTKKKQEELVKEGTVQLVFRPFLRWLDRNLETIVTDALVQLKKDLEARAAGLVFIPASQLQQQIQAAAGSSEEEDEEGSDSGESRDEREMFGGVAYRKGENEDLIYTGPEQQSEDSDSEDGDLVETAVYGESKVRDERRGTEVKLRNLTLKENASTLTCLTIKLTIQCARCKNKMEVSTPPGRPNLVSCGKCSYPQILTFRQSIMHQFSSVMGYLDLDGCVPFDLILQDCTFKLGCFSCNKEMKAKTIAFGQITDTWCFSCHSKMKVSVDSVKFSELGPSDVDTEEKEQILQKIPVLKKKNIKEPEIQLGRPLPDEGTCKHYKKSFRWFRFPCCGKCYPCDICHEEKEDGHEMLLATRMICGHCCREQPFALEKPCIGCRQAMTKVRSAHWEGGKGCRDKIKMNRNDAQKYAGQSKTVSRKTQEKQKQSSKKNTKLRHSSK